MRLIKRRATGCGGFTVLEAVVTLGLLSLVLGIGVANFKALYSPIDTSSKQLSSFLMLVRAKAISTTSALKVVPANDKSLVVQESTSCKSLDWTLNDKIKLDLESEVSLGETDWTLCFSSRGLADKSLNIALHDNRSGVQAVEVLVGGVVRVVK